MKPIDKLNVKNVVLSFLTGKQAISVVNKLYDGKEDKIHTNCGEEDFQGFPGSK